MIAKDDIVIRKAILHILDTNRGECILSNTLLDPGPDLHDFSSRYRKSRLPRKKD